jgi:hypothetical protein
MADLITVQQYKDAEGLQSTKEDYRLELLIASVSQLVKTYCGNSLIDHYSAPKVETFTITWDTHLVQLTESPANAITSVQERQGYSESYTVLAATDFYLDTTTDSVIRTAGGRDFKYWAKGPGSVIVTYTAGYPVLPADLKLAVLDLINYYLKDEYKERQTLAGASIQNSTGANNSVEFPAHIKRVLDLYKNF